MRADVVRGHACPGCGSAAEAPCRDKAGREKTRHCAERVAEARLGHVGLITEVCPAHPTAGETHESLADEMRCAYCGNRLAPYPCHACGKFLTARRMHEAASGEMPHHCEECLP